jgi:hypothetical protein
MLRRRYLLFVQNIISEYSPPKRFFSRSIVLSFSVLSQLHAFYWLIGKFNQRLGFINSVFVTYPANSDYLNYYCFDSMKETIKWKPTPLGIFRQGKKWGLVIGVPMTEADFTNANHKTSFGKTLKKLDRIKSHLGVNELNMAGILPSHLAKRLGDSSLDINNQTAAQVVYQSIIDLTLVSGKTYPIILLGGMGSVGTYLQKNFSQSGSQEIYIVDPRCDNTTLPIQLKGKPAILVDIARKGILEQYVDEFWSDLIILNETYPEPSTQFISQLKSRYAMKIFHIGGVKGAMYPQLPYGYKDCVPCCAMHDQSVIEPVIKEL